MTTKTSSLLDAIQAPASPFPGLRPFESNENDLFFGRDEQTEKMMDKLAVTRFLAVVGTSGSGKSSLVRAGLMPALHSGMMAGAGSKWRIAVMRPSNDPIGNLARALNAPEVFGSDDAENQTIQIAIAEATLRLGSRGLIEAVCQNLMPQTENLLVVVDQFEELFRFAREARKAKDERYDNDAAAFVKLLLEAVKPEQRPSDNGANIYVVLTMRSDFLGDCSQFWDLPEAINESQYLIPRLTRDQLREVIEGPVAVGGGQIAPRLVNQLLNDITDNQDQLPILQHALMRAWDEWKHQQHKHQASPGVIDLCCYEEIGGMADALSDHADEAFDELPDDRHRLVAEKMFKALTEKGEDNREIRRPVTLGDLCAVAKASAPEVKTVIEAFRLPGRSFLMPPAGTRLDDNSQIDISHESLIRGWKGKDERKRLKEWVDDEAASSREYLRLVDTATRFREGRESVLRDSGLQTALDWRDKQMPNQEWAQRYHTGFDLATGFLEKSRAANDAAITAEKERQAREIKRTRLFAGILGLAFLVSAALAVYGYQKSREALAQRREALAQKEVAEGKTREAVAANADALIQKGIAEKNQAEAELAKADALGQKDIAEGKTREAERAKADALIQKGIAEKNQAEAELAKADAQRQRGIAEGKTREAVAANADALIQKGKAEKNQAEAEKQAILAKEQQRLAETNQREAAAASEKSRHLYYAASMNLARSEFDNNNRSRGYELLESLLPQTEPKTENDDRSFYWYYLWKHNFAEIAMLEGHNKFVTSVAFSSDGKTLATGSEDGTVKLWDMASPKEALATLEDHKGGVFSLAFSSDGKTLATGGADETMKQVTVKLWDVASPKEPKLLATLNGHTGWVNSVAFNNDGKTLATGSGNNTVGEVKLWDVASPKEPKLLATLKGHAGEVTSVAFSSDGKTLATGSKDGAVKLWDVASPREPKPLATLPAHKGIVYSVAFSSDDKTLATGGEDGTVKLWDVASPKEALATLRLQTNKEIVFSVAFSRDDKTLATGISGIFEGAVMLWDVASRQKLATLKVPGSESLPVAFSSDGKTLATGFGGNTVGAVKLWDVASLQELATLKGHDVRSVAFSSDGKTLATGSDDGTVKLWDVAGPKEAKLLATLKGHTVGIKSVAFSSNGKTLATGSDDGTVKLWDVASPKEPKLLATLPIRTVRDNSMAFSNDGKMLATTGGWDETVRLWDVASPKEPKLLTTLEDPAGGFSKGDGVDSVAFSSDGKTLAMSSYYSTLNSTVGLVKLWDVASPKEAKLLATLKGHTGRVESVAFSNDGKTLATGSGDNTVKLWDVASLKEPKLLATLEGHTESVNSVAFSSDGKTLATSSAGISGGAVKLWDVASRQELVTLKGHGVRSVAFSSDGKTLAMGSWDETVKLYTAATEEEVKAQIRVKQEAAKSAGKQ